MTLGIVHLLHFEQHHATWRGKCTCGRFKSLWLDTSEAVQTAWDAHIVVENATVGT